MKDKDKSKEQLIDELNDLRVRLSEQALMTEGLPEARHRLLADNDATSDRASEEQMRFTQFSVDMASDAIFWIRTDAKVFYVNETACKRLGYSREEMLSMHVWDFDPLHPREAWLVQFKEIIQKGSMTFESQHKTKLGEVFPVEITLNALEYQGQKYLLAFVKDITERKKAEEERRRSENKFQVLFNQSIQFTGLLATDGTMLAVNQTALAFVDYDESTLIGKLFWETPWWTHSRQEQERLQEAIRQAAGGEWVRYEATHLFPDGTLHYFDFSLKPVLDDSGNVTMLIPEGRDITERKQAEKKLLEYQNQLRSMTSQLALLEEQDRRRFAIYLHDQIGQALYVLKLKLEMLRKSVSSSDIAKSLEEVREMTTQIIKDTRSLTSELSPPVLYQKDLVESLEWLVDQFKKQDKIIFHFHDDKKTKPLSESIHITLFQIVRELLTNTVKHARAKEVKVSLGRHGDEIRICVEDNGVGFSPAKHALVRKKNNEFGLFSIKERLDHLGGHLEIESKPRQGTRMTIIAPMEGKKENGSEGVS